MSKGEDQLKLVDTAYAQHLSTMVQMRSVYGSTHNIIPDWNPNVAF